MPKAGTMAKNSMSRMIESIGAESLAAHLREEIQRNQRDIAMHYSNVDGMSYPNNLLGEMEELLAQRDYPAITSKIESWQRWLDDSRRVREMLERTLILIESFVVFYRAENGLDGD